MAEKMLSEKLGEVEYDGLIAGVNPKKRVGPGVIAGPEAETTFVRGTVFAKSAKDGKLHILGTEASGGDTLTADCILIEDVTMKASMDETVAVYLAGCFNPDKLTCASVNCCISSRPLKRVICPPMTPRIPNKNPPIPRVKIGFFSRCISACKRGRHQTPTMPTAIAISVTIAPLKISTSCH